MMTRFENRLWASAAHIAADAGMTFTVPCSRNVRDLIRAGIAVMIRAGRTSEADLETADAALSALVAEMVRVTRALGEPVPADGRPRIRETALVQAKRSALSWPFA